MALKLCTAVTAASWIADSDQPWYRLVSFGPSGFPAYPRLRFIPDPAYPGQSENDVTRRTDTLSDAEQLHAALDTLLATRARPTSATSASGTAGDASKAATAGR